MLEKIIDLHKEAFIIFIDYSKAFDSVSHNELFKTLITMGFPPHLVALIQSLYTDQTAKIRWNCSHTKPFRIGKGVRQGCILSPHLFSTYIEQIMRDTEMERYGIVVGGRKISNLRYADDIAICANNQTEATTLMNELNDAGERKSLKLNAKKTKYMHIGKEQHASITIGNEEIECVEHFNSEMWFYRCLLRVSWKEKRTDEAILAELQVRRHLLESIRKRKLSFFGHICRSKCTLMKDTIQGKLEGKRGRGRPRAAYLDNIKTWTRRNSTEIYTMTERREEWRELVQKAVRAANASRSDAG
ncbi:retrovirus-related pol polyprotein from type-1 retrotransposable element r2 [Plakobranchus ocellatus]|uniref:Retrovirus-related pol polyprotein from type-1 retrotransposable element r2 n=1 Tax=Plakobranchus ocellatus TaxID=259542 RepID=A0AAV4ACL8_9GAST|nr:retrovirus-related pol polyprotein from type-1 retrotransposable element r2 [Plakobranchus ocellatus]